VLRDEGPEVRAAVLPRRRPRHLGPYAPAFAAALRAVSGSVRVRAARETEVDEIHRLAEEVIREMYGHLFPGGLPPLSQEWTKAHVAELDGRLVGVVLTEGDRVTDLWVGREHRSSGVGAQLLLRAEEEIGARGHEPARLRVMVENAGARRFYARQGW